MPRLTGQVRFEDLEGGLWLLVAEDGTRYQLDGGDPGLRQDGQRVEVEGEVADDSMGFGMTGPILRVRGWSRR